MNTDIISAPIVMAIKIANMPAAAGSSTVKTKSVGVAYADSSTRELGVADFVDNDLFSNTEVRLCAISRMTAHADHSFVVAATYIYRRPSSFSCRSRRPSSLPELPRVRRNATST